jgi:dTDP-4-dehydro-6-deoxy-alpha-D-gulose 4-ketoreductase
LEGLDFMASYWAGKTVLVTGGMGFIGSHFVEELLARDARVVCAYRRPRDDLAEWLPVSSRLRMLQFDLLDQRELEAVFRYAEPRLDAVIQCAAIDGNAAFKASNPAHIMDANLRITSNVLNCARKCAVPDVVLLSSAEVYLGQCDGLIREQDDQHGNIRHCGNGYLLSKVFTEILAELYREQFGMCIYLPRLTNIYGERDDFTGAASRVIPRLITGIASGQEVEIWGDGSQTRTFIHVLDVVRTTLCMVETSAYQTFNIGTSEAISMLELARLVAEALGERPLIRLIPDKPAGPSSRELDLTLMSKVIDFTPARLRDGLREVATWYLRQKLNT